MSRSRLIPASSAAVLALVATGLSASPAAAQSATTVSADWDTQSVVYTAQGEQANDLHVFSMGAGTEGRRIGFSDVVPILPGDHCTHLDPLDETFVVCELPTDSDRQDDIRVFLGDGDDKVLTSDPGVSVVRGGLGDDELHAHTAPLVMGDEGDDMVMGKLVLMGGDGMDHLMGNPDNEVLLGGAGPDMIHGYGGRDTVYGGAGNDDISGGEGDDFLFGGGGDDVIHGDAGEDLIVGGRGEDEEVQ